MANDTYTLIPNLEELVDIIQPDSIISRTFYKSDGLKAILFGFDIVRYGTGTFRAYV